MQAIFSKKFCDDEFFYRYIVLPFHDRNERGLKQMCERMEGWIYMGIFQPEPHILIFKKPLGQ